MRKNTIRILSFLLIICLFVFPNLSLHAEDGNGDADVRLLDAKFLMSDEEFADLNTKIHEFIDQTQVDLFYGVFGDEEVYEAQDLEDAAEFLYKEYNYGKNATRDAVIFLYAPATGHYYMKAFGSEQFLASFDSKMDDFDADILKNLNNNDDVYSAGLSILENMRQMVKEVQADSFAQYEGKRVIDEADKLSDDEEAKLESLIGDLQKKHKVDIVYVLLGDAHRFDNMQLHDFGTEMYEMGDFGVNETKDTVMLMMSTSTRKYEVLRFGQEKFKNNMDKYFEKIRDEFIGEIKNGRDDYYSAGVKFANAAVQYANIGYFGKVKIMFGSWIPPVIGLVVAILVILFILSSHKGTIDVTSMTYEREGSYHLTRVSDHFKYSRVDKTRKSKDNDSGGGGGSGGSNSSGGGSY